MSNKCIYIYLFKIILHILHICISNIKFQYGMFWGDKLTISMQTVFSGGVFRHPMQWREKISHYFKLNGKLENIIHCALGYALASLCLSTGVAAIDLWKTIQEMH